jgi:hypothetical protein
MVDVDTPSMHVERGCCSLDGGALLLKRYARPSIGTVVDLPYEAVSNGPCAASGRL